MANQTLDEIRTANPATTLTGTEVLYVLQGGNDAGALASQLKTLAVGAGSVAIASGKTLTASNTLTFVGTDGTTFTFPTTSATVARTDAAQSFTGAQTFSGGVVVASGQALKLGNAATTGLVAGVLAAQTNASIVVTDSGGQAYRILHNLISPSGERPGSAIMPRRSLGHYARTRRTTPMAARHRAAKKYASGGKIEGVKVPGASVMKEAEADNDGFKKGGKIGVYAKGGAPKARMDRAPRMASGGSVAKRKTQLKQDNIGKAMGRASDIKHNRPKYARGGSPFSAAYKGGSDAPDTGSECA